MFLNKNGIYQGSEIMLVGWGKRFVEKIQNKLTLWKGFFVNKKRKKNKKAKAYHSLSFILHACSKYCEVLYRGVNYHQLLWSLQKLQQVQNFCILSNGLKTFGKVFSFEECMAEAIFNFGLHNTLFENN